MTFLSRYILPLVVGGCVVTPNNFSIAGEQVQRIHSSGVAEVVIRCYCPSHTVRYKSGATELELRIEAAYSSIGYHGKQKRPTALPDAGFVEDRSTGVLALNSREYTYIHHALIIKRLEVIAPSGLFVQFEPIDYQVLEDRRI